MEFFKQHLGLFMVQQEFKDTNPKTIVFFILRQSNLTHAASSENMGRAGVGKR